MGGPPEGLCPLLPAVGGFPCGMPPGPALPILLGEYLLDQEEKRLVSPPLLEAELGNVWTRQQQRVGEGWRGWVAAGTHGCWTGSGV